MSVVVRDKGARKLQIGAASMKGSQVVDVGVIGEEVSEVHETSLGDLTIGALAEIHEFGLGVPRRSWLRDWVAGAEPEIKNQLRRITKQILLGKITERQGLAQLGVWAQGQIQARIAAGIEPANSEVTIALKGSSTPLIASGQFRSSITNKVRAAG